MKVLFLSDAEMKVLRNILHKSVVHSPNGRFWERQSILGKEFNYTHGKLSELCRRSWRSRYPEDKEREMAIRRERNAAIKLAKRALNV